MITMTTSKDILFEMRFIREMFLISLLYPLQMKPIIHILIHQNHYLLSRKPLNNDDIELTDRWVPILELITETNYLRDDHYHWLRMSAKRLLNVIIGQKVSDNSVIVESDFAVCEDWLETHRSLDNHKTCVDLCQLIYTDFHLSLKKTSNVSIRCTQLPPETTSNITLIIDIFIRDTLNLFVTLYWRILMRFSDVLLSNYFDIDFKDDPWLPGESTTKIWDNDETMTNDEVTIEEDEDYYLENRDQCYHSTLFYKL